MQRPREGFLLLGETRPRPWAGMELDMPQGLGVAGWGCSLVQTGQCYESFEGTAPPQGSVQGSN